LKYKIQNTYFHNFLLLILKFKILLYILMKYKIQNIFMYSEQTQNTKYYCLTNTVFQIKIFQIHVQSCPIALDNVDTARAIPILPMRILPVRSQQNRSFRVNFMLNYTFYIYLIRIYYHFFIYNHNDKLIY